MNLTKNTNNGRFRLFKKIQIMEDLDFLNPYNQPEYECRECGKPMDKDDYCSNTCWEASML
jgi:hypothetical protein